jgi:hypothetical protein
MVTKNRSRRNNPASKSNAPPVKMPESINNITSVPAAKTPTIVNEPTKPTSVPAAAPTKALEPNVPASAVAAPAAINVKPELEVTPAVAAAPAVAGTLEAAPAAKAPAAAGTLEAAAAPAAAGTLEAAPAAKAPAAAAPAAAGTLEAAPAIAAKAPDAAAPAAKTTDPAATGEPVSAPKPDAQSSDPAAPVPASTTDAQEPEPADELAGQPPDGEHDSDGQPPTTTTDTTTTTDPNCTIYASPFSSANPDCYVPVKEPQLSQIAKAVLHAPVDAILDGGAGLLVNALEATGNKKLVEAALAESLTSDQAKLLSTVMTDPNVEAEVDKLKSNLSNVITTGIDEVKETVLPPLETAIGEAVGGTVESILAEVDDIPPFGALRGAVGVATTVADTIAAGEKAIDGLQEAAAPLKKVMGEVGDLTAAMNKAALNAEGVASSAEGAATSAEDGVASAEDGVEGTIGTEGKETEGKETKVEDPNKDKPKTEDAKTKIEEGNATKVEKGAPKEEDKIRGGGSRKRRHIHKLSRRIERTLRRVQKKYGLKDKNDFLRRTLRRGSYVP